MLPLAMFGIGTTEIVIFVIVLILLFGPSQIPKLAKSFGQTIKESRKALNELSEVGDELQTETRKLESDLKG